MRFLGHRKRGGNFDDAGHERSAPNLLNHRDGIYLLPFFFNEPFSIFVLYFPMPDGMSDSSFVGAGLRHGSSSTCSKFMAFSAEGRGVMGFLVVMTGEAGLPTGDLPCVGGVTTDTWNGAMFTLLVQPANAAVARSAIGHRFEFRFFKMACVAGHRHHRGGGVKFMTRDAVERWSVTCLVAKVAEGRSVTAL